ncbi:MAG: hypothetical protein LBS36_03540 [Oscillospiraceae bacterium]|nr:hypothetical protein [Oscillospiraceae bacterium]
MKRFLRKKDGYILAWVLCFFLIVAVISVTTMSFAVMSTQSTAIQHNARQAQFTAKSAVVATVDYIAQNATNTDLINSLMLHSGTGNLPNMGDYTVDVEYASDDRLKVTATAEYNGQRASSTAYLVRSSGASLNGIIPADNVIYVNGDATEIKRLQKVVGNVYIDGQFSFSADSDIAGRFVARDSSVFSGNAKLTATQGSFILGNLTMANSEKVMGDLFVKGSLDMSGSASVTGNVLVDGGDMSLSGSGHVDGNVQLQGNMRMNGGGACVYGNLSMGGDITLSGGAGIKTSSSDPGNSGNLYAAGSLTATDNWATSVYGNAVIGGNVALSGQSGQILKKLSYGGSSLTYPTWVSDVNALILGGNSKLSSNYEFDAIPEIDESLFVPPALPVLSPPSQSEMSDLYKEITAETIQTKVISKSGKITQATVNAIGQLPWVNGVPSTLQIDATNSDICLLIDNVAFNPGNGVNFEVKSGNNHNVYIFMTGASSFTLSANQYMGMDVRGTNPRLYIIGDAGQTITLSSNSELDACVYMPKGKLDVSGSPLVTYKFIGVCIVKNLKADGDATFHYSKPPGLEDSKVAFLEIPGSTEGTGISWEIGSWGEK